MVERTRPFLEGVSAATRSLAILPEDNYLGVFYLGSVRLVQQHPRVREHETLALRARQQQDHHPGSCGNSRPVLFHSYEPLLDLRAAKGHREKHSIKEDHEPDGQLPQEESAVRHAIEDLYHADRVYDKGPRDPCRDLPERKPDEAEQDGQSAQDHHGGLRRENKRIGKKRNE